ncbi:glycosyltransferase [Methanolacinia paynteri]|uniref:glycosyltransferase n=1 Tax=Methanolacinia paynteri TaxID=230356 RepID=UPI000AC8EB6B|nr:glycosyltransferase [Methanolacinia paynteri]
MDINNLREELSFKYIRGEGIEVGPLHQPLPVPPNVVMHYVDRLDYDALLEQYPEISKEEIIRPDIIDDAYSLKTIKDESYDFCICNHVFEHMRDPIGAFINWMRILKSGGILYLSIRDASNPLDLGRDPTTLEHMIEDSMNVDISKDRSHFYECAKFWHRVSDDKVRDIAEANWRRGYSIHYHVFNNNTIDQILDYIHSSGINFTILDHKENEINGVKEYIFILRKTGYEEEIFKELEKSEDLSFNSVDAVDVVIPIYNAYDDLCECLQSLLKYRDIYRIFLINDCSTDKRIDLLLDKIESFNKSFISVIRNRDNQGFVKTVNIGMKISNNDVILLNSDTIVTENWAKKIRDCAYEKETIATVTPFTNNGTICSIPEFCKNNDIPPGFTIDSFGKFVESLSFHQYPEIPTAVGFCMYIKREILERIGLFDEFSFDKGYCEENDFCMRVIKAGYSNQLCDNTFIYHKGESSFNQTKNERIERNMKILSARYPDYLPMVGKFCEINPLYDQHLYFKSKLDLWNNNKNKKRILYVLHPLGGGTEKHVLDMINSLNQYYIFFIVQVVGNDLIFTETNNGNETKYYFPMKSFQAHTAINNEYSEIMKKFIDTFEIDLIHVHHLIGHSLGIFQISAELEIPIIYTVHDFFCICPRINMINEKGQYCNLPEVRRCNSCGYSIEDIESWRSSFLEGFRICNSIITPSNSAMDIISHYFPEIKSKCIVIEHGQNIEKTERNNNASFDNRPFHIAYIGVLAKHKGQDLFYDLARCKELSGITKWSVIGISEKNKKPGYYQNLNINITGAYKDFNHLQEIVYESNVDLILLPAIWPETFSFTLSEAWCLGIPVLGSDLGAIKERIVNSGGGWTVDMSDMDLVKSKILSIINDKKDYLAIKENVKNIHLKSLTSVAHQYHSIYQKNIRSTIKDSYSKFDNWELYKSMRLDSSRESLPVFQMNISQTLGKENNLYKKFRLCLKENGLKYTIGRIGVYCSREIKKNKKIAL